MQAESPRRITSLSELADINPSDESIKELRKAFEEALQQKGSEFKEPGLFPVRFIGFSTEAVVGEKKIPVSIFRRKSRYPEHVSLYVDIGMRTSDGERVRLEFRPDGKIGWLSLDRSLFTNRTFPGSTPTKNDLELHRQVLDVLTTGS